MILKYIQKIRLGIIGLIFLGSFGLQAQEGKMVIDKIVAKVDNYIVLKSEVERTTLEILSRGQASGPNVKCQVLETLIMNKLMVAKAEIDSIVVSEDDVQNNIDRRFQMIVAQVGSVEEIEKFYGKTVQEFKAELGPKVREQLIIQKMEMEITSGLAVTPAEVKKFFKKVPGDSLPYYSKEVAVSQLVRYPSISKTQLAKVEGQLREIRDRIVNGGSDFEDMARKFSQDPGSASRGGNYGYQTRGSFVPEYEAAVFKMKAEEISDPVKSDYGYHLIQLVDRRGNEYKSRHILLTTTPGESDIQDAKDHLDSIRNVILADSISFEIAASEYSDDIETAGSGGFFLSPSGSNLIAMGDLDPVIFFTLDTMEQGEISVPVEYRTPDGKEAVRLLYFKESTSPHIANLKEDYQKIYSAALNQKRRKVITSWFNEAKLEVYIDIDEDYNECKIIN